MIINHNESRLQDDYFLKGEGDAYFNRKLRMSNVQKEDDLIFSSIARMKIKPKSVLEIGCANGFRLNWLYQDFKCDAIGIEPSKQAVDDGNEKFPNVKLQVGTFDILESIKSSFDTIILGFFFICIA